MHYYIDGYNLLFRSLRASGDLKKQREIIIQELGAKIQFLEVDATIVFDAHYQPGESTKNRVYSMAVLYTSKGETADDFIISQLKSAKNPRQITVVTSDKKLAWRSRCKMAHSETIEEFIGWLNRRYKNRLRHLAEQKKNQSLLKSPPTPEPIQKEEKKAVHAEGSIEYYEELFEKKSLEIKALNMSKKEARQPKKQAKHTLKSSTEPKEKTYRSEMERWLDLFGH